MQDILVERIKELYPTLFELRYDADALRTKVFKSEHRELFDSVRHLYPFVWMAIWNSLLSETFGTAVLPPNEPRSLEQALKSYDGLAAPSTDAMARYLIHLEHHDVISGMRTIAHAGKQCTRDIPLEVCVELDGSISSVRFLSSLAVNEILDEYSVGAFELAFDFDLNNGEKRATATYKFTPSSQLGTPVPRPSNSNSTVLHLRSTYKEDDVPVTLGSSQIAVEQSKSRFFGYLYGECGNTTRKHPDEVVFIVVFVVIPGQEVTRWRFSHSLPAAAAASTSTQQQQPSKWGLYCELDEVYMDASVSDARVIHIDTESMQFNGAGVTVSRVIRADAIYINPHAINRDLYEIELELPEDTRAQLSVLNGRLIWKGGDTHKGAWEHLLADLPDYVVFSIPVGEFHITEVYYISMVRAKSPKDQSAQYGQAKLRSKAGIYESDAANEAPGDRVLEFIWLPDGLAADAVENWPRLYKLDAPPSPKPIGASVGTAAPTPCLVCKNPVTNKNICSSVVCDSTFKTHLSDLASFNHNVKQAKGCY